MKDKFIDLHMHSLYSDDGEFTPKQLVEMCRDKGIEIMAIADHNSVKGIAEAKEEAEKNNISYISAIEIDCKYKGINLHVLGYGIDENSSDFAELEEDILNQEKNNSLMKIELTNKLGFDLTKEQMDTVSKNGVYTGEMFAEVLLDDERYIDDDLLKPYRDRGLRSDNPYVNFYWDYYAQGKPCYTEVKYLSLKEAVSMIRKNKGIAVLAHPGNNLKGKFEVFDEMVHEGLAGVEAFSNYHDEDTVKYFLAKAEEYKIIPTCGSDFHGKTKPAIELGETRCIIDENKVKEELIKNNLI